MQFLQDNWLLIAGAILVALRSQGANGIIEGVLSVVRALTNTPTHDGGADMMHGHDLKTAEGRVCLADCLAKQFAARGAKEIATAIRKAVPSLFADEINEPPDSTTHAE